MKSLQKSAPFAPVLRRIAWNSANYVFNLAVPAALFVFFHAAGAQIGEDKQTQDDRHKHGLFIAIYHLLYSHFGFFFLLWQDAIQITSTHTPENMHIYRFI